MFKPHGGNCLWRDTGLAHWQDPFGAHPVESARQYSLGRVSDEGGWGGWAAAWAVSGMSSHPDVRAPPPQAPLNRNVPKTSVRVYHTSSRWKGERSGTTAPLQKRNLMVQNYHVRVGRQHRQRRDAPPRRGLAVAFLPNLQRTRVAERPCLPGTRSKRRRQRCLPPPPLLLPWRWRHSATAIAAGALGPVWWCGDGCWLPWRRR